MNRATILTRDDIILEGSAFLHGREYVFLHSDIRGPRNKLKSHLPNFPQFRNIPERVINQYKYFFFTSGRKVISSVDESLTMTNIRILPEYKFQ